jgi:uncharacterized membrane-anchored protein YhcB (DUF1043 family)
MLLAGIIVAVYSLLSKYTMEKTAFTMLIVLVVFFIIGSIIQNVLNRILQNAEISRHESMKEELDKETQSLKEDAPESSDL